MVLVTRLLPLTTTGGVLLVAQTPEERLVVDCSRQLGTLVGHSSIRRPLPIPLMVT